MGIDLDRCLEFLVVWGRLPGSAGVSPPEGLLLEVECAIVVRLESVL